MNIKHRIGIVAGVFSILFSTFCLIVMPVFTGAIIAAPLVGLAFAAIAATLRARRTAAITVAFALVPLCGFLVMENFSKYFGTGYVAFLPLAVAAAAAAWTMVDYSRAKAATPESTAQLR